MERTILFSGTETRAAARFALKWVCEEGGTFIMPNRTMLLQTIGIKVGSKQNVNDAFERAQEKFINREKPVSLGVANNNDYRVISPRVAITSPNDGILTTLEAKMNTKSYREHMQGMMICIQSPRGIQEWAEYYLPVRDQRGQNPDSWQKLLDDNPEDVDIPSDIEAILAEAAKDAAGETNGRLHIDMIDSIKYDIDVNWSSWKTIPVRNLMRGCSRAGVTLADANDIRDWYELKEKGSAPRPSIKPVDYFFEH